MPDKIIVPEEDVISVTSQEFRDSPDLMSLYARINIVDQDGKLKSVISRPRDARICDETTVESLIEAGLLHIRDEGDHWAVNGFTTVLVWKSSQEDSLDQIVNRAFETAVWYPRGIRLDWDQKRRLHRWVEILKAKTGNDPELSYKVTPGPKCMKIVAIDEKSGHECDLTRSAK